MKLNKLLNLLKFKLPKRTSKEQAHREKLLKDYKEGKIIKFSNKGGK